MADFLPLKAVLFNPKIVCFQSHYDQFGSVVANVCEKSLQYSNFKVKNMNVLPS